MHARDSVWAFELTQRADEIRQRLDGVAAITFVPGPLPEVSLEEAAAPSPTPVAASPEQRRTAEEMASGIADEDLRKIVTKAIENALANAPDDRSF